ncbi:hypothetical protein AYO20_11459 [Fonsecaea nubica]|uniref:FAD/NAD(P)-binding domain-containing protein n=1 Tax=Fonsecaea nubica TaxID=856822 RepID=A0A178BVK3_9EURO|nr:hypothetical protein AYO20_11459 [Fonsecaea nubica]OAL20932.1 hypothetical protein AYO20_11459 [Fonsecaea nubica]
MAQATTPFASNGTQTISANVVVVGGGFGGCYALYALREAGYTVKLIEAGSDFGGVWHFNKYPGARVDSEVPLYQLSHPDAWRNFNFKERYPGYVELRAYFSQMAVALDLYKDAIFNARVIQAKYDSNFNRWTLSTNNGIVATAQYAIFATGTTNKPYVPKFPGLDSFCGTVLHPCRWPDTASLGLKNKKVGIVGQGASGLQILQELAKEDIGAEITVFLRNPPTALPMKQRSISAAEAEEQKNTYNALYTHSKTKDEAAYAYNPPSRSFFDATPDEREKLYTDLWTRGSYAILTSNYPEISYVKEANAEMYQYWAKTVRARITDTVKRDIMAPLKQFQWIGTKRPNLEMDYYEMIDRPNVRLVNLKEEAILRFTKNGVTTSGPNGEATHDLDIVIMATGYDSVTGSLYEMNIVGKDGVKLQDHWSKSIQTYLGMLAPEFPNMFMLYGPQAPSGLANGPPFLEMQVDWIVEFLAKLKATSCSTFEVKHDTAKAYVQRNLDAYSQSLAKDTPSWWNGSNIPGKTREPLFWTLGLQAWRKETERAIDEWSGFELK